ncbi:MAG: hypothetical protein MUO60_06670, partial [Clostridiaceae bacterium]|nr:hypothetical protein [Clostridiaceae bacterium]
MRKFVSSLVIVLLVTLSFSNLAYAKEEALIKDLLFENERMFNPDIINNPNKYNLQILYTEINRDNENIPIFTSYRYNVDAKKYFYPASSVKLSACILSLDKINTLKINGLS